MASHRACTQAAPWAARQDLPCPRRGILLASGRHEWAAPATLPGQAFEIPLTDDDRYILHHDHVELQTPRGSYRLWPESRPR